MTPIVNSNISSSSSQKIVSVIYFPGQRVNCFIDYFLCFGHAELEVGSLSYTVMGSPVGKDLANTRRFFTRCQISVSEEQITNIKNDLKCNRFNTSCIRGVCSVLSRSANFHIPAGIKYSPLLTQLYLRCSRIFDNRIVKIENNTPFFQDRKNLIANLHGIICESAYVVGIISVFGILAREWEVSTSDIIDVFTISSLSPR